MEMLRSHGLDRLHRMLMGTLRFMVVQLACPNDVRLVTPRAGEDEQDSPCEKNHQRFCAKVFQHGSTRLLLRRFPELDDLL